MKWKCSKCGQSNRDLMTIVYHEPLTSNYVPSGRLTCPRCTMLNGREHLFIRCTCGFIWASSVAGGE